jgi:hypothetical protein
VSPGDEVGDDGGELFYEGWADFGAVGFGDALDGFRDGFIRAFPGFQ